MTPEEKRQGAFEVLDELLAGGADVDSAIIRAAEDNELKPEIFRAIAEKELGNLSDYSRKVQLRSHNLARQSAFRSALARYVDEHFVNEHVGQVPPVRGWLEHQLGRQLSADEITEAEDRHLKAFGFTMSRDLGKLLKGGTI